MKIKDLFPSTIFFQKIIKIHLSFFAWKGEGGFKIPIDLDNDGNFEIIHIRFGGIDANRIFNSFDNDNDGIINQNDSIQMIQTLIPMM